MRNRTRGVLVFVFVALLGPGGVFAQAIEVDLTPLYNEFGTLFAELGTDTLSHIQQFGLMMNGTGRAEVGKSVFFAASAGTVFLPGVATFRADDPSPFTYLDSMVFSTLEQTITEAGGTAQAIYDGSETFFLNPGLRLSGGFALANGLEVWGNFGIVPQAVAGLVGGLGAVGMPSLELNRLNAGGRVRMVLVHDQKGLPAVSVGVGYTYTQFNVGLDLVDLQALLVKQGAELQFGEYEMALQGIMHAQTRLHTAGVELAVSKKLAFLAPFLRFGAWYQWASYTANIEGLAVTLTGGAGELAAIGTLDETVQIIHDMAFTVSGGLEIVGKHASLILEGSFDTASATPTADATLQFRI